MPYRRPGIARSGALLVIAAVVPVLVFAGFSAVGVYSQRQTELRNQALQDSRRLLEAIDRELASTLDQAQTLASLPALDDPRDLGVFTEIARREHERHDLWLTVLLLDVQGRRLVNSRSPDRLGPAVEPASLAEVVRERRPLVGSLAKGPSEYGLPFRAPVLRNGAAVAVVTVVVRPDGIRQLIEDAKLPPNWIASVVDANGQIVARSQRTSEFIGKPASAAARKARAGADNGVYDGSTLEGVRTVSAFWRSPASGWSVHIGMPREVVEAPLNRSIAFTAVGSILSLILAGAFTALLLRELKLRRQESLAMEQAFRLEALGRLTGGVAHDFNNLLMVIQGNAETLQRRLGAENVERPLAAIREATARASRLTRELLVFARAGSVERQALDLNDSIRAFVESVAQAVGPGVAVDVDLDPKAGVVEVDRVQLELAILNLAVNARDAMDGEGRLSISTARIAPGRVEIRVSDNGSGIPDAVAGRVFDPFFTTKPTGSGTGLGLTQVYGFAQQSGGTARLGRGEGQGAVVVIELPTSTQAPSRTDDPRPPRRADFNGRTLLLLDDNAEVRAVSADYLREAGAEVVEGDSGSAGLALLGTRRFDAVVSDIIMPGELDGIQLAERLKTTRPGLPVVLVSGYSASTAEALGRGFRVLRKPFVLADLEAALTEALQDPSASLAAS